MTHLLGALSVVLLVGMVLTRVAMLRTRGVVAMRFGAIDKTDFLIPPFPLLYLYLILASAFDWPTVIHSTLFASTAAAWAGVALCALAVGTMAATLVAFGSSFRVGIDTEHPDKLITGGIFAHTRNPIYVAFALALCGEFLILPTGCCCCISSPASHCFIARYCARKPISPHTTAQPMKPTAGAYAATFKAGLPGGRKLRSDTRASVRRFPGGRVARRYHLRRFVAQHAGRAGARSLCSRRLGRSHVRPVRKRA